MKEQIKDNIAYKASDSEEDPPATILLVDDHLSLLSSLKFRMESYGYRVFTAENGRTALEIMAETHPDLIISDIMMPIMDGFDFFQAVRSEPRWLEVPFIFLSAKGAEDDVRYGKLLGAEEYIIKPFDPEDLRVAVAARLRRARELKQHADQDLEAFKKQLIGVLSHEFKTPLSYIKLATALLSSHEETLTPQELQDSVRSIQRGESRLTRLVDDILAVATIDAGLARRYHQAYSRPCKIGASVRAAVEACQDDAAGHNIIVNMTPPPDDLYVLGLERQLTTIFTKLLSNAIKFSREGGRVAVTTRRTDERVAVTIQDWGQGIPAHELPRLFDRFYQVNRKEYEQQGAGLGLTIAKAYTELYNGHIEAVSEEGIGSTFTVWLPLIEQQVTDR